MKSFPVKMRVRRPPKGVIKMRTLIVSDIHGNWPALQECAGGGGRR